LASSNALATTTKNEAIPMVGWLTSDKPAISYNETTRTLTLTKGTNDYAFYCNNKRLSKSVNDNVFWANTEGVHVVYYDINGNLTDATTSINTIMQSFATVATFYWSVSQQKIIGGMINEMHETSITPSEHLSNHTTFGTRFAGGLTLSANATGTGNAISDIQYSGSTGVLDDDGLQTTLNAKNLTDNFALIYRTGASGLWQEVSPRTNYIVANGGTGRAVYNQNLAGTWQLTEISNNNYGITYIYAVPAVVVSGVITQFFGVIGQNLYTTLNNAQAAAKNQVNLGNLPFLE
jgi:hypothetical protein